MLLGSFRVVTEIGVFPNLGFVGVCQMLVFPNKTCHVQLNSAWGTFFNCEHIRLKFRPDFIVEPNK